MSEIDGQEMRRRLVNICLGSDLRFPRRERDRQMMLVAASVSFKKGMIYTERQVDSVIRDWLDRGCPSLRIDEVTLRRELIDAAYLMRDDAGRFYAVGPGPSSIVFSDDIRDVDPFGVVAAAIEKRAVRKRAHGT